MDLKKIEIENPGQRYISNWIIYSALGEPNISPDHWKLKISGRVRNPKEYSYEDIARMPVVEYISDFNCVTAWSIPNVKWSGPSLSSLLKEAEPMEDSKWVMFRCADGYSTPVPIEFALKDDAVIALRMNDKPLRIEQGFPARPFLPDLYGWESAKWLTEVEVMEDYKDGYWEQYGYHERGLVASSERYTNNTWRRVRKTVTGMFKS